MQWYLCSILHHGVSDELILMFQSFTCKMYKFPRTDPSNIPNELCDISAARYHLFRKSGAEGEKLPPSIGAFRMHVMRHACVSTELCLEFCSSIRNRCRWLSAVWFYATNQFISACTKRGSIAPDAVIEMISCKSCKRCNTGRCPCRQANLTSKTLKFRCQKTLRRISRMTLLE